MRVVRWHARAPRCQGTAAVALGLPAKYMAPRFASQSTLSPGEVTVKFDSGGLVINSSVSCPPVAAGSCESFAVMDSKCMDAPVLGFHTAYPAFPSAAPPHTRLPCYVILARMRQMLDQCLQSNAVPVSRLTGRWHPADAAPGPTDSTIVLQGTATLF